MSFTLGKILDAVVSPPTLIVLVAGLGLLLQCAREGGWLHKSGKFLTAFAIGVLLLLTFVPLGDWMLRPIENRFSKPDALKNVYGVIVLSGGENEIISADRNQPTTRYAADRLTAFAALARQYPNAKLIYSGGSGRLVKPKEIWSQATIAGKIFKSIGMDMKRITFEDKSRTTYENAVFSGKLLTNEEKMQPWLLVTSAYHMPRSVAVFRAAGWRVIPYPVGYHTTKHIKPMLTFDLMRNLGLMGLSSHEYLGLLSYAFMGKTDTIWPGVN